MSFNQDHHKLWWDILYTAKKKDLLSLSLIKRQLEQLNIDINDPKDSWTILTRLTYEGEIGVINTLLEMGFDLNIDVADGYGKRSLEHAVHVRHYHACEFLIGRGAEINFYCTSGMPFLSLAVGLSQNHIAKLALSNGADTDMTDDLGNTALHMCIISDNEDMLECLLNRGARHISNFNNCTPLDLAHMRNKEKMAELIRQYI